MTREKKIQSYIKDHFVEWYKNEVEMNGSFEGNLTKLNDINLDDMSDICNSILYILFVEKVKDDYRYKQFGGAVSLYEYFEEWCKGLCEPINTTYYNSESSLNDLLMDWYDISEKDLENCSISLETHRERTTTELYDCILEFSTKWGGIF